MSDPGGTGGETSGESRTQELLSTGREVWRHMLDPKVPMVTKIIPVLAILYLLSPIDLIPDTIPLVTQIDDLAVLLIAARVFMELVPDDLGDDEADSETLETTYRVQD